MLPRRRLLQYLSMVIADALAGGSAGCNQTPTDSLSVKRFGAIGDGASHPISEWVPSRYADLRAIQQDYPDARSLTDEIDYVAINKAVRIATEKGLAVEFPAGTYLAWIYVHGSGVSLIGAGAAQCRIRLPDGAQHRVIPENRGAPLTGTPCVIEAGITAEGNRAASLKGLRIKGMTLDGNAGSTAAPQASRDDIFGWGLAFTNYSQVYYRDIVAVNCHAGGIGTFINSDHHDGEAVVSHCGEALSHPGFDINSSHHGRWRVTVNDCPYGVRMLDNCWNSSLEATVNRASLSGVVCDNQPVNESYGNTIVAVVRGGCRNSGVQIGDGWSRSHFDLTIADIDGVGVNSRVSSKNLRGESGNVYKILTLRCGYQSAVIGGKGGKWKIESEDDGFKSASGSIFLIDVYGDYNYINASLSSKNSNLPRGIVLREKALGNNLNYNFTGRYLEKVKYETAK